MIESAAQRGTAHSLHGLSVASPKNVQDVTERVTSQDQSTRLQEYHLDRGCHSGPSADTAPRGVRRIMQDDWSATDLRVAVTRLCKTDLKALGEIR